MAQRFALIALLVFFIGVPGHSKESRPNIILILSDDHTYSHYGFMGNGMVQTPNLDRMAGESLLYTRGYSMPVCSPSLASLLTGLLPSRHGITGNDLGPKEGKKRRAQRDSLRERLFQNPMILPKVLSDSGYLTFQTGKLWNTSYSEVGFTHGMTKERSRHGGAGLTIGREGMKPIEDFIDLALEEEKPFFVWYAPFLPHDPHNPPERLKKKYVGKGPTKHGEVYHAMIEWLDETCGDLDEYLKKKKLKENTMIIYLSDNGWDPKAGYKGGRAKLTPYENGIRTPIFARWPGKVTPQRDDTTLASIIDVVPTMLKAAGIEKPVQLKGIDLRDHESMKGRDTIFVESYLHDIMDLEDPAKSLISAVVINKWSKLILPGAIVPNQKRRGFSSTAGTIELFDLKADPKETSNLAEKQTDEVVRLTALQKAEWDFQPAGEVK